MTAPTASTISPWMPEQDRIRLAALGKLIEECNELAARAARCIIQGIEEADPDTGRPNSTELAREMSDVIACFAIIESKIGVQVMAGRVFDKINGFCHWHKMIEGDAEPQTQEA